MLYTQITPGAKLVEKVQRRDTISFRDHAIDGGLASIFRSKASDRRRASDAGNKSSLASSAARSELDGSLCLVMEGV